MVCGGIYFHFFPITLTNTRKTNYATRRLITKVFFFILYLKVGFILKQHRNVTSDLTLTPKVIAGFIGNQISLSRGRKHLDVVVGNYYLLFEVRSCV